MLVFFLYPILYNMYISFFSYTLGGEKTFNGGQNYLLLLKDSQFLASLGTTAIFIIATVAIEIILGLTIAFLLNKETKIFTAIRTLILLPTVFPPLVVGLIWKALYHPDLGLITYYLRELGVNIGRGLLVERHLALFAIVIIDVWEWTPLVAIMLLSGLKSLPRDPYEAAVIDGANGIQLFSYITIPLLKPTLYIAMLIRALDSMKAFDTIFATTNGGPGTATTVANLRIYEVGIQQSNIGYASALSNVLLALGIILGAGFIHRLYSKDKEK
jgi:multiple sugar transport system permease protein